MPAIVTEVPNRIRLRFVTGVGSTGNPTYSTQSFGNVKENALHDDVYDVADALAGLCGWDLEEIIFEEDKLLIGVQEVADEDFTNGI